MTDADIEVTFRPIDGNVAPIVVLVTRQEVLSDYYSEADTQLPSTGEWEMTIGIEGADGAGSTTFSLVAQPARTINWILVGGGGAVLVILIALAGIQSRMQQPNANTRPTRPGQRHSQRSRAKVKTSGASVRSN